jgi:alpha-tubulin suppressor-like RCC1 family protein
MKRSTLGSRCAGFSIALLLGSINCLTGSELASQPTASTSFVIDDNKVLYGWGRNDMGQVGNGSISAQPPYVPRPVEIAPPQGASGWKRISAGWGHTIAIADNDQLYAWGYNGSGRLGTGHSENENAPAAVTLPAGLSGWSEVAAGAHHSLAVGSDGRIYAWGANDWGELGNVDWSKGTNVPTAINLPSEAGPWKSVAAGNGHSLALSHSGHLYYWGRSVSNQPEGGEIILANPPTRIPAPEGASGWRSIGAGYDHSFAITDTGKLYAWGENADGQLGIGSTNRVDIPQPVSVPGVTNWAEASGGLLNSIGLDITGNIYEWGRLPTGESSIFAVVPPRPVVPPSCASGWRRCTAGYLHNLAIARDCKLFGWGTNDFRQLSVSKWSPRFRSPQPMAGLEPVCVSQENRAPTISISTDSIQYNSPAGATIRATIFDCEANAVAITFYESTNVISVVDLPATNAQSQSVTFIWSNVVAGAYTVSAEVVDAFGASASSEPVHFTVYSFTNGITDIRLTTNEVDLAEALLAWDCGGIHIRQITTSAQSMPSAGSIGVFQTTPPLSAYGLAGPGIVISTGNAADYRTGVNSLNRFTTIYGTPSTPEQELVLDAIAETGPADFKHFDVTELSVHFDLAPGYDRVQMRLIFGSEEYPEFVGSHFIDVFGILLNGVNIASVDGTIISPQHTAMTNISGTELDGVLAVAGNAQLVLTAELEPGSSNNVLTFILADTSDAALDTTVYVSELKAIAIGQQDDEALRVGITPLNEGEVRLQVSGIPCGLVAIESSPDLSQWTVLGTNAPQNGIVSLTTHTGTSPTFFRARRIRDGIMQQSDAKLP